MVKLKRPAAAASRPTSAARSAKVQRIAEILDALHPEPPIPLQHDDPFTLLVAVVLSAQTTDVRVNLVTPALFQAAPTPNAMAGLGREGILRHIRSVGLAPQKAANIAELARRIEVEHGGEVPRSFEALEALPGVGHKTASVVMSQSFGVPAFPVDTHIHRLAARFGLSRARNVVETERDLKLLFPPDLWAKVHLQMIWFGRTSCPARGHDFDACPVCSWAASKARRRSEARAARKPQKSSSP